MTSRGFQGHRDHKAANPAYGATFHVWLAEAPAQAPELTVHDVTGAEIAKVTGKAQAGLQAIGWDGRLGQNRLAKPGSYAVKWPGQAGTEARPFELLPDPATVAADDDAASPAQNRE